MSTRVHLLQAGMVNGLLTKSYQSGRVIKTPATNLLVARAMFAFRLLIAALLMLLAVPASAQVVYTYVNPTDGNVNGTTTCANPLVRTFVVSETFTVANVKLGFFGTHTWRGDFRITLVAPNGTSAQLVTGDANSISGDNLNVLLSDDHTQMVNTDPPTGTHSTVAPPPFQNNFRPNAPLSVFNGLAANGTWALRVCDIFPSADNGIVRHLELYLSPVITPVSVTKVSSVLTDPQNGSVNPKAIPGALVEYTVSVTNPNSFPTANVVVTDFFPPDLKICLSNLSGQGPVSHTGIPANGLTYSFVNLNSDADSVEFTTNAPSGGGPFNWTYDPVLDANTCDAAITGFRLRPGGSLNAGATVTFRARFIIK